MAENKYWAFYGQGKIDAEQYYAEFLRDKSTNLVILRPPYIYGEYNYAQRESLIFRQLVEACAVAAGKLADIMETDFEEGLKKPFAWFLENRDNIVFKANVDKNLYEIIAELSV